jgi:SAM-dependent methyltransferase
LSRIDKFSSVLGENWITGRYLLPWLASIGQARTGIVLDMACGESPFRFCFNNAKAYIRIDRKAYDPGVLVGDLLAIPLPESSVDVMLLCQAITDSPYPADVLNEVRRVLRPRGVVIVFESMCYPEHDLPFDYFRLMPEGLRVLGKHAGLRMTECVRLGGLFTRFSMLWNTFLMGRLKRNTVLKPIAHTGILFGNLLFFALDRLFLHPRLASDYVAVLTPTNVNQSNQSKAVEGGI